MEWQCILHGRYDSRTLFQRCIIHSYMIVSSCQHAYELQHEAAAVCVGHRRGECGARPLKKPGEADNCCHGGHVRTLWPPLLSTDAGYSSCLSQ